MPGCRPTLPAGVRGGGKEKGKQGGKEVEVEKEWAAVVAASEEKEPIGDEKSR